MRAPEAGDPRPVARVPEVSRWQVLLMEYEMLDAYWIHLHQRIWMSALVLMSLSMVGITFLGAGFPAGLPRLTAVTFIAVVAILITVLWWLLVRRMLTYMRITEYRKGEIEQDLGMRMELYMGFARGRRGRRGREAVLELAHEAPDLGQDLSAFVESPVGRASTPLLPVEELVWNLIPLLFIGAWVGLWAISR